MFLIYGNHPKSRKLFEPAKQVINLLREKGALKREEVANELKLDLNTPAHKKKFYNIISPMFGKILVSERRGREVYYKLSYDVFRVFLDNLRRKGKYYLVGELEGEKPF